MDSAVDTCEPDIIALTETWLQPAIGDHELFANSRDFSIYRCDRVNRSGGGVLLAINKKFPSDCIQTASSLEIVWAVVTLAYQKIILGVCYRPPSFTTTFVCDLHDAINSVFSRYTTLPIFLLGDFNMPNLLWKNVPVTVYPNSSMAQDFLELCSTFSLTQLIKEPTRITPSVSNTLDLILTTRPDLVSEVTCLPGISDHSLLSFKVCLEQPKMVKTIKTLRNYNKADFLAINNELAVFLDDYLSDFDYRNVQSNWSIFLAKVVELTDKYIPAYAISSNLKKPWYNHQLKRLSNKKKRLFKSAKLSNSKARWSAYKQSADEYVQALKVAKDSFLANTLPTMLKTNPKKFWRVINPQDNDVIVLNDLNGDAVPTDQCSNILNDVFSKKFFFTRHRHCSPCATI